MASNSDYIVTIYDVNGDPVPGITPIWDNFYAVPGGAIAPAITPVEIGGGLYSLPRNTVPGTHYVGVLDFGVGFYPRYVTYDSRAEESLEPATSADVATLLQRITDLESMSARPYVQFDSSGDSVELVIQQVLAEKQDKVLVTFSKPVVMTTDVNGALRVENYLIEGLAVTGVEQRTPQQVRLTTFTQTPRMRYNLTVLNVEDLNGNPIHGIV